MSFGINQPDAIASLVSTKLESGRVITGVEFSISGAISLQRAEQSLEFRHSFELSFETAEALLKSLSSAISLANQLNAENGVPIVSNVTKP
ncbi:hypothetical protein DDO73_11955 [Vibrio cholerae]|uniref:hypothetical protein n=1 Tax=Vibrio cholerae TaxID=666 RepID=UPI00067FE9A9|nr:hypothetical protein [Vibrio cholerae]EGR4073762.1 hypothetical protein [Vibrio cholerae]MBY4641990.1 hypothetical protein [Vibrio cholerae]MCR9658262.1 hypothetical protein [Vibrio cholerae]MCR9688943.1 hypothetical protein [Vibrio cholerae]MCR9737451.1 hypothetical protein [Vibrio cholerae]